MASESRLKTKYLKEVAPEFMKSHGFKNIMAVPKIEKIVVNVGMGEALTNSAALDKMAADLSAITGQKTIIRKSKKAISNFKIREADIIGLKVTLRKEKMWDFLDKLMNIVMPRVKDFRGLPRKSFDGRGNYSIGIREHVVFPEVDTTKMDKIRSFEITIVTTANNDEDGMKLLEMLGMPFIKKK